MTSCRHPVRRRRPRRSLDGVVTVVRHDHVVRPAATTRSAGSPTDSCQRITAAAVARSDLVVDPVSDGPGRTRDTPGPTRSVRRRRRRRRRAHCVGAGTLSITATTSTPSAVYSTVPCSTGVPISASESITPGASLVARQPTTSNRSAACSSWPSRRRSDRRTDGRGGSDRRFAGNDDDVALATSPVSSTPSDSCQASTMSAVLEVYSSSMLTSASALKPNAERLVSSWSTSSPSSPTLRSRHIGVAPIKATIG